MIQYILEAIAFQLVFLVIYDLFLKKETFFQWNRVYLIGTYCMSLILPWVKLEAFQSSLGSKLYVYPEFLLRLDQGVGVKITAENSWWQDLPLEYAVLIGGMFLAALWFGYKLFRIYQLRKKGQVRYFPGFTRIVIANSGLAFSFFRSIFLGDRVIKKEHGNIIQHELVHIEQGHTLDLLFFESMRIVGWFNPLVYVYQSRISELHEFIADAKVGKNHKKEQYQWLLAQVFQTENISFINQFYKSSLIKKRIVMLQKAKSKKIWKLKYLFLIPILTAMLFYSSCQNDDLEDSSNTMLVGDIENLAPSEESAVFTKLIALSSGEENWILYVKDSNSKITFSKAPEDSYISGPGNTEIHANMSIDSPVLEEGFDFFKSQGQRPNLVQISLDENAVPFGLVEEVPIFPGCENEADKRGCFNKKMQEHIRKYFNYPKGAQELGIQGRVNIMFTIDQNGNIQNIRKRGPHELLEGEAVRIIERLPEMKPGKLKGKAVNVPFSIPISFKLK